MINLNTTDYRQVSLNKVVHTLLEIQTTTPIYLVDDNQDFVYNGHTFERFPFAHNGITDSSKGEVPRISFTISNVTNLITHILEEGIDDTPVIMRLIREGESTPDIEYHFIATGVNYDAQNITLNLTVPANYTRSYPSLKFSDFCPFQFKSWRCKYSGSAVSCNKTSKRCKELGNYARFGGFNR